MHRAQGPKDNKITQGQALSIESDYTMEQSVNSLQRPSDLSHLSCKHFKRITENKKYNVQRFK